MNLKEIFLQSEGNAYFERNFRKTYNFSRGTEFLSEFLKRNPNVFTDGMKNILEIGCCDGRNLRYLTQQFKLKGFGIDPSKRAIEHGQEVLGSEGLENVKLLQGTSDELPFERKSMDIVILGFCMYVVDRQYLLKSVAEVDRVLKRGGFLLIEDFDVPNPIQRPYAHDANVRTYKCDYTGFFLGDPSYSLIEKKSYSHSSSAFDSNIQERVSSCILYKEPLENVYQPVN